MRKVSRKVLTVLILVVTLSQSYKVNAEGINESGWKQIEGKWYYYSNDGSVVTGWAEIKGKWYYLKENGDMATGWVEVDNKWYYLDTNGVMTTGWVKVDNKWYYLNQKGAMKTGWNKINNNWYYFYIKGSMAINSEIDGWKIGSDGIAFPKNIMLNVGTINQHKVGLKYGCEAMATLMALEYKSNKTFDAYNFGISIPMDKTPVKTSGGYGGVYQWGDPEVGFVGDITGKNMGSTIYPKPLVNHLKKMGYEAEDLSGYSFENLLDEVRKGNPVVAWVSLNMNTPNNWSTWKTPQGKKVRVTFSAHSVTITGVDDNYVYYNDSWTGSKNKKISRAQFEKVYNWRGKKSLVIK